MIRRAFNPILILYVIEEDVLGRKRRSYIRRGMVTSLRLKDIPPLLQAGPPAIHNGCGGFCLLVAAPPNPFERMVNHAAV